MINAYNFLSYCAFDQGDEQEEQYYMELFDKVLQSTKSGTEMNESMSRIFRCRGIKKKPVSEWTNDDKLYLEEVLSKTEYLVRKLEYHIELAKYEMEHGSIPAAREHLSHVMECEYPNRFLTTAGQLMAEIEELPI